MSILLEALRKSEKKQRPHETPTIHTEVQSGSPAGSLRAVPLSLLLVAALLLTGWFVWKQYRAPEGSYQPPVTLPAEKVHKAPRQVAAERGVEASTAKPAAPAGAPRKRTPVESYEPPEQSEPAPEIAHTQPSIGQQADTRAAAANPAAATAETPSPGVRNKTAASPGDKPAADNKSAVAVNPGTGLNDVTEEDRFHPGEPEPIGYWELPDSIRADVPEIKFSVLVYAADPSDRFVLVNGQRLGEGESLKPGLVVKEIRRDGVVFSYRLYQFLVER